MPPSGGIFFFGLAYPACASGLRIRSAYPDGLPAWRTGFPQAAFNAAAPAQILPPQFARMRENCGIVHKV
jgi:hypothetical protein